MNDPHVEALHYRLSSEVPNDTFNRASPLRFQIDGFDVELEDCHLVVRALYHFSQASEARKALEPFLHSWEEIALLEKDLRIRFNFLECEIKDRKPSSGASMLGSATLRAVGQVVTPIRDNDYPTPDPAYVSTELTRNLVSRFKEWRNRQAKLAPLGYWVLDTLQEEYGGRDEAEEELRLKGILDKLGDLTASPDPKHGRKARDRRKRAPDLLEQKHLEWIEAAIKGIIRRVGETAAGQKNLPILTVSDFEISGPV
jgi:hypothetical protein